MSGLTHFDQNGNAVMVDVSGKSDTARVAVARGLVVMAPETLALIRDGGIAKGDVLAVARLAGIMGAKRTPDLIPLCHPIALSGISIAMTLCDSPPSIAIEATAKVTGQTGVEMEALTAVSVAALTVYDMVKAVDRGVRLTDIRLVHKSGGKSGDWDGA